MSLIISVYQHVKVDTDVGLRLAHYDPKRDRLTICPEGLGIGPMLSLSLNDWAQLCDEVRAALQKANLLSDYTATEGNGDEL